MIKTIKVKKQFRLDELLKYVWDNELNRIEAVSSSGRFKLKFIDNKSILVNSESTLGPFGSTVSLSTTEWEIEVEEEVTEDTELFGVQEVCMDKEKEEIGVEYWPDGCSINDVLNDYNCSIECLQIYAKVNGKLQLVWEAE